VYELAQDFMQMLRHREGQRLDVWLGQVRASHIPELQRFVRSIQREEHFIFSWRSFLV
jgi:transposase